MVVVVLLAPAVLKEKGELAGAAAVPVAVVLAAGVAVAPAGFAKLNIPPGFVPAVDDVPIPVVAVPAGRGENGGYHNMRGSRVLG